MKPKIALQLWSIQDDCRKDFDHALGQVKEYGYDGVEFAGYYDHSAEEVKELLEKYDLEAAASHIPYDALREDLEGTIAFEKTIGNTRIVVPYATFETFEEWKSFVNEMSEWAKVIAKEGMTLYYHNHSHEFTEVPGQDILDYMLKNAPEVQSELDLYWLANAGKNVLEWIDQHSDQVGLFHMKDMQEDPRESTEIGTGILPMKTYVEKAKELDFPWLVVEQEAFQEFSPLEAAKINVENLNQLIKEVYA